MRIFIWILRIVLFLLLFVLAIKNDGLVTVRAFLGTEWQSPLIIVMLIMFAAGALLGATAAVSTVISQRLELKKLRKQLQNYESSRSPVRPDLDNDIPGSL